MAGRPKHLRQGADFGAGKGRPAPAFCVRGLSKVHFVFHIPAINFRHTQFIKTTETNVRLKHPSGIERERVCSGPHMLRVEIQSAPGVATLRCSGKIVLGVEAETLRCMATSRGEEVLVLDLREVHSVDAAGLGLLVELCVWAQARKGVMAIANPSRRVRKLVTMTRLNSVLRIADFIAWDEDFEHDTPGCCAMTA